MPPTVTDVVGRKVDSEPSSQAKEKRPNLTRSLGTPFEQPSPEMLLRRNRMPPGVEQ